MGVAFEMALVALRLTLTPSILRGTRKIIELAKAGGPEGCAKTS
jgi:hypothetical protein